MVVVMAVANATATTTATAIALTSTSTSARNVFTDKVENYIRFLQYNEYKLINIFRL